MSVPGRIFLQQIAGPAMLTCAIGMIATVLLITPIHASDRDTPVYRIYVDPVTGKYSTEPPEDKTATTDTTIISGTTNSSGILSTPAQTASDNNTDKTTAAPLIAVLLLTGTALVSLLLKRKQQI